MLDASWINASHGNILNRAVDNKKLIADETIAFLKENDIITNISQPIVGEFKPIVDCIQSEVLLNTEKIDSSSYLSMDEMCSGKFEEVFSDWWSIELTNYYLERALPKKPTSNTFSPDPRAFVSSLLSFGCSKNNFIQEEAYLPLPDRIKFIFSHPKLNTKFNCQKTPLSSFEKCLYSKNGMPSPKPSVDAIK